jgi:CBS domain-containing protein
MRAAFAPAVRTRVLVREVMNSPVITASPEETIKDISQKMASARVGSVVIMQNDQPVGIVTDGDIVFKVVSSDSKPSSVNALEVMSKPLYMIESEKEILEAAKAMRRHHIKRLGVVYKQKLVGIISISDILAVTPELFEIVSEKALIVTGQASSQPKYLAGYCDVCNQWSDMLIELDGKFTCEECNTERKDFESSSFLESQREET